MKASMLTGLLAGVFCAGVAAGYFAGRSKNASGAEEKEGGWRRQAVVLENVVSGSVVTGRSRTKGLAEAERRVRAGYRPFEPGRADAWAAGLIERMSLGVDVQTDLPEILLELSFLDTGMAKEAAEAFTRESQKVYKKGGSKNQAWRDTIEAALYREWAKADSPAALASLESVSFAQLETWNAKNFRAVFGVLGKNDPGLARVGLKRIGGGEEGQEAVRGYMDAMMMDDPERALREAAALNHTAAGQAAEFAAERLLKRDPKRAVELAAELVNTPIGARVLNQTVETWAETDAAAAEAWVRAYAGEGRNNILAPLLRRRLETDFEAVAAELATLADAKGEQRAISALASAVAEEKLRRGSPAEVTVWLETLPEGRVKNAAEERVVREWLKTDVAGASEWIHRMPPGENRDASALLLVDEVRFQDPEAGMEWAKAIHDPALRRKALNSVFELWRKTDPEAAARAEITRE